MEISEVRVKLVNNSQERLKAFCSITLENDFVIRDLKVIDGTNGIFVAMPSRKLSDRCPGCGYKNHLRAHYCNECGKALDDSRADRAAKRGKLHADIAHPINAACRERIQDIVIKAFEEELEVSKEPGYQPPDFDYGDEPLDDDAKPQESAASEPSRSDHRADHHVDPKPDRQAGRKPDRQAGRKPDRQVDRRQEEQAEPPAVQQTGGYDELIAELKSDAEARRRGQRPTTRERERDTVEPSAPSESTHRDDRRPATEQRDREREDVGVAASSESSREAPAPAPRSEPEPPPAPKPAPPKQPPAPEPEADDDFGAGIL